MSPFKKVTVFGAGVMGHSLALLHAQAAETVCLVDTSPSALKAAVRSCATRWKHLMPQAN